MSSPSYGFRCSSIIKTWCRFAFQNPANGSIRRSVDIYIEDGQRRGKSKVNPREAEVIVEEIASIVEGSVGC